MFSALFLTACAVYVALDLQLVRGLARVRRGQKASPPSPAGDTTSASSTDPLITILVAARDEEHNLPRTLDHLLAQDWPAAKTQIVVVDDRSQDGTPAVLRDYAARFPGRVESIRVDEVPAGVSPKKNALARGLGIARGEWIAVTDADCVMGTQWLRTLATHFDETVGMVFGVTTYEETGEGGFTPAEGTRALEFVSYGVTNAGLSGFGFPVSANANNLAYRRRAFDAAGGFARHGALVSGDDDFTLQEIHAAGWSFRFCAAPAARVRTAAPATWTEFWEQRKRWAGKCIHYRAPQVAFLLCIYTFYLTIALLLVAGFFRVGPENLGLLGLTGFAVKTAADFVVMRAGLNLFGLSALMRFFPFTAALHIPVVVASVPAGVFGRFTWKGQKMGRKA